MSIQVDNLHFNYGKTTVLGDITLQVTDGEIVSLVGPNGAGKSTLLKCMNRILKPSRGTVRVDGQDIRAMEMKRMARLFGYVPQTTISAFPATVFDTVLLGRRPYVGWTVGDEHREIVYDMLIKMDLDHLALRQFNALSAANSNGLDRPGPWCRNPGCCSWTNRRAIWISNTSWKSSTMWSTSSRRKASRY